MTGSIPSLKLSLNIHLIINPPSSSYKHALDGIVRVAREEGLPALFRGATSATSRAVLVTIGQLSFYDQIKITLLSSGYFSDNLVCHFASSLTAVGGPSNECFFPLEFK